MDPSSLGAVQASSTDDLVGLDAVRSVTAEGAVVSDTPGVEKVELVETAPDDLTL